MSWTVVDSSGNQKVSSTPAGAMMDFAGSTAPTGWLLCDGTAYSRTTYATLFAVLGTTFGVGDNSTTFNVPDFRGRVSMGAGTGAQDGGSGTGAISGGTALTARSRGAWGGAQTHTLTGAESGTSQHQHGASGATVSQQTATFTSNVSISAGGAHSHDINHNAFTNATVTGSGLRVANIVTSGGNTTVATQSETHSHTITAANLNAGQGSGHVHTLSGNVNNSVEASASSSHNNVQPFLVVNKIIKF